MSGRSRAVPSSSRRGRSRKRRPQAVDRVDGEGLEDAGGLPRSESRLGSRRARAADAGGIPVSTRFGERPRPPWHPVPLAEMLIVVGAVGLVVGFRKGPRFGDLMLASLIAVAIGTLESTLREHLSGYRSHAIMLSVLPVVIFHATVAIVLSSFTRMTEMENFGIVAVDVILILLLFKVARARFLTARTLASGRG